MQPLIHKTSTSFGFSLQPMPLKVPKNKQLPLKSKSHPVEPDLQPPGGRRHLSGPVETLTAGFTSSNTDASSAPSAPDNLTGFSCVNTALSSVVCGGFMARPTLVAIEVVTETNALLDYAFAQSGCQEVRRVGAEREVTV